MQSANFHWNGKHKLCKKQPVYLQSTKDGICTQCRTRRLEASMARSNKGHAEEQHRLKEIRSGLIVASKSRKPTTCSHIQTSSEELYKGTQNEEGAAKNTSATPVRHIGLDHFRCRIGLSHTGPCIRATDQIYQPPHYVSAPTAVDGEFHANKVKQHKTTSAKPAAHEGVRALFQLRGSANPALSKCDKRRPRLSLPHDNIKTATGAGGRLDEQKMALRGPRALKESQLPPRGNWNLIEVTKPVSREDHGGKARLHGPRTMPTPHRIIRKDWNLMTAMNPVRRANGGRLHLRGPQPITSPTPTPKPNPIPRPDPAAISFGARHRKAFNSEPLIRQEVHLPIHSSVRENQQLIGPDTVPNLPVSYKPVLAGRHPLHRALPPIPDEAYPEQAMNCQPPPVPPHLVLPRRKVIGMPMSDDPGSDLVRYLAAPEAPVGIYFGREMVHSGWQPPRCETVVSSFLEYQP